MSMKFLILCYLCIGFMPTFCCGADHSKRDSLKLELSLQRINLTEQEIIVQLAVANTGKFRQIIPYLQAGLLERHAGWWGWGLFIKNHQYRPFSYSTLERRLPMLTQEDIIELQAGEQFTVLINIADTSLGYYDAENEHEETAKLADTDGVYEVQASLRLYEGNTPGWYQKIGWQGEVASNTIRFPIIHERRRTYFPEKPSAIISPDGRYAITNMDGNSGKDAFSLGGKHALYLHNTRTNEQEKIYVYEEHVEVVWSPKGDNVLINDYGESSDCRYYCELLIFFLDKRKLITMRDQLREKMGNDPHLFGNNCVRIMGIEWLSENRIEMRIQGYGDVDPGTFRRRYEYHVLDGEFRRLE